MVCGRLEPGCVLGPAPRFVPPVAPVRLSPRQSPSQKYAGPGAVVSRKVVAVGSVVKKRRKRMAKKKHRKLLKKTRIQRRRAGK
jgi:hypothetical protein